ncbi:sugar phosphate isomerase/epimerase [bacterium]|nr:sugar phosphate isomerase/epimerase [bacterium]
MKFSISNLAWKKSENTKILNFLKKNNILNLEYSYKILVEYHNKIDLKKYYSNKQIKLYSMQSILFGLYDCFVFGSKSQNQKFVREIKKKILIAKKLGSEVIVFGSPKNKKNFGLKKGEMNDIFLKTMKKVAKFSENNKVVFCLEANPKIYDCDFLNYTNEALSIVKKINNNYFKLNLDFGTILFNNEDYKNILDKNLKYIGHIQLSLPLLKDISKKEKFFLKALKYIKRSSYSKVISIEQLRVNRNFGNIQKVLKMIKSI